ncbi:hypothetical protein [Chromobacterium paludis]|uniref:hypothetical protein n=1 Tax=Chromobacterium paludis TaxID=2605945 RepID=UPI00143D658F|nr:hypothetical protein [Chromobacterium paludis]
MAVLGRVALRLPRWMASYTDEWDKPQVEMTSGKRIKRSGCAVSEGTIAVIGLSLSLDLNICGCNRIRRSANAVFQKFQIEFGGLVVWNHHTTTKLEKPKKHGLGY